MIVDASVWGANFLANMEGWRGIFSILGRGGLVGQCSGSICGCRKDKLSNSVVYMGERGRVCGSVMGKEMGWGKWGLALHEA